MIGSKDLQSPLAKNQKEKKGCELRWIQMTRSVQITEANSGFLRGSIARPTAESATEFNRTGPVNKIILNKVSGTANPGEVLALMGPSGSGKTSLLNILSCRATIDSGFYQVDSISVKGAVMKRLKSKIGYVKQSDIFFDHLTVRDQLTYTAMLRLPKEVDKHAEVEKVISMLRLASCADTKILLVSGGERKRVNIGTELLTDPLIIMLDEPTSGLDSTSAVSLVQILHEFAKRGKTVVTSIHQPSSGVFRSFDKLCLLAEGNCVYFGTPAYGLKYLEKLGYPCPHGYNAADHWMDLLVNDSGSSPLTSSDSSGTAEEEDDVVEENGVERDGEKLDALKIMAGKELPRLRLIQAWKDYSLASERESGLIIPTQVEENNENVNVTSHFGSKYNTSWFTQMRVLLHRSMKNSRAAIFTPLNIIKSALVGLMMGLLWFQLPYTEATVNDRVSYYFFTMTYWVFDAMFIAFMAFPLERDIIFKERDSGAYKLSAYFLAKTVSEAPARLFLPSIYMIISYWIAGINSSFVVFVTSTCCTLLSVLAGESCGLLTGAAVFDFEKGMVVMTVVSLTLMVLGGFFVSDIPPFISWLKYLSPFKYAFDASQQLVFNKPVPCDGSGLIPQCNGGDVGSIHQDVIINNVLMVDGSVGFNVGMLLLVFLIPRYLALLLLSRKKSVER